MARIKLSEYRAKNLLYEAFGIEYKGQAIDLAHHDLHLADGRYVVKVDQAVKRRNTLGLVRLQRSPDEVAQDLQDFASQGYSYALVESYVPHDAADEYYLSLRADDRGIEVQFSSAGGVDIESNKQSLQSAHYSYEGTKQTGDLEGLDPTVLEKLLSLFASAYMTYLEINPLLVRDSVAVFLDAAVEVDSAARFWNENKWGETDERSARRHPAESEVEALSSKSPASLTLKVLNPDGAVFLLLSGGGASVVAADEVAEHASADLIANYGEYSGNPSEEETYLYTRSLLGLLKASKAPKKVLLIAGGVANFTDIAKTFKGIIRALRDDLDELQHQDLTILVRRGGPNQMKGLQAMEQFLVEAGLKHEVHGPELSLAAVAQKTAELVGVHHG